MVYFGPWISHLSRPALPRCFQRHGISRLPLSEAGQSPPKKRRKDYPTGYLHVDFAEAQTEEGKPYLFVAVARASKVAFVELHPRAQRAVAAEFRWRVPDKLPYKVHPVLTDHGVQFTPSRTNSCRAGTVLTASAAHRAWNTA